MNQAVTDYIDKIAVPWQAEVAKALRDAVHKAIPDVDERIQYSKPHFLKKGKYAAVIGTAKGWVSFTIFSATDITGPDGFFEDGPPERKTIKVKEGQSIDYDFVSKLVKEAADTI